MAVNKIIPDIEFRDQQSTTDDVTITIKGRDYPLQDLTTLSTLSMLLLILHLQIHELEADNVLLKYLIHLADYGWRAR